MVFFQGVKGKKNGEFSKYRISVSQDKTILEILHNTVNIVKITKPYG
jgi:hypothetical protein